ncbi:hypothetical protein [Neomoorella thermoacetica]|uniref:hypothetical protein n=1 Tax=Neomoorella thermoacetica TaxID=1525 RepID=UPI00117D0C6D|nr:hypothetical protein [Moorella thermoacetica]
MFGFANQSKVKTNAGSNKVVNDICYHNCNCNDQKGWGGEPGSYSKPNKKQYDENGITGTLTQFKNSSLCDGVLFIVMSSICLIGSYMLGLRFISPSMKDFLYFLYNPSFLGEKFLGENYARVIALSLTSWIGLTVGVKGIYKVLPQKIADSWVVLVVLLVFLLLPLGLMWSIWSFHFVNKLGWTIVYLMQVWMLFVLPEM